MINKLLIWATIFILLCSCHSSTTKTSIPLTTTNNCVNNHNKTSISNTTLNIEKGIQVLYFHNERRCATCMAVEEGAVEVVKQFNDSSILFQSYLIGDPKSKNIEEELEIEGQSLLIVSKDKILDITNMAFLNARTKPDYFKEELKKQIERI